jgi:hypothetical protein
MKLLKFYEMAGKRGKRTNLSIRIDDRTFFNKTTAISFRQAINYIVKKVGGDLFKKEIRSLLYDTTFPKSNRNSIILDSPDNFPDYVSKSTITPIDETDLYLSSHLSNQEKKNILESIFKHFKIDGSIEVIKQEVEESESGDLTEDDLIDDEDEDELNQEYTDETDTDQFENKGEYSNDVLRQELDETLNSSGKIITPFIVFLEILLSENIKFDREEIKYELFRRGTGADVGKSGQILSNISQFITKFDNDHIRQVISYDIEPNRYSDGTHSDVGATKNNYQIIDKYRNLVQEVIDNISSNEVENQPVSNSDVKFWLYAPGDSSKKWDEFYNAGIMGLGWDELGDFDELGSRNEISTKLRSLYPDGSSQTNSSLAIYEFRDVIKPGDIIIPKRGTTHYLGYGVVTGDNYFDEEADELKNRRKVDWKKNGLFKSSQSIVQKTLTDITKYPDYVKRLIELIGIEGFSNKDDSSKVLSPYDFFSSTTGAKSTYSIKEEPTFVAVKPDKYQMSVPRNKKVETEETSQITDEKPKAFGEYSPNPFDQAICVLGESGAGKSTSIDNILKMNGHKYQYIIPSASTTGLLSQFSPRENGYIQSRLGKMIEDAWQNPNILYTAVFDECHKTNTIEMINDELLQSISKDRNFGNRFISLDEDTAKLFKNSQKDDSGNIKIPNNFGFIFISSKPEIFQNNPDFFNRVDLLEITEGKRPKTIEELNNLRKKSKSDKKALLETLEAKQNQ